MVRTATRDIYVTANGLRHHLLARGEPGHPVVILIHGRAGQAHVFDQAAERLAEQFHVYALDVRGRGESAWGPAEDYRHDVYVEDLEAIREALGLQHFSLVGTWMGALIAVQYGAHYPERVDRIVMNDIGPDVMGEGVERLRGYLADSPKAFPDMKAVVRYFRDHYGPVLEQFSERELEDFARWHVRRNDMGVYTWKYDPGMHAMEVPPPHTPHWEAFDALTCPVLVIRGRDSEYLSAETLQRMQQEGQHVTALEVPGSRHVPTLMDERVISAIEAFLAGGAITEGE
jgi:pimeloyl-ACP methyl ester carboxylesterase